MGKLRHSSTATADKEAICHSSGTAVELKQAVLTKWQKQCKKRDDALTFWHDKDYSPVVGDSKRWRPMLGRLYPPPERNWVKATSSSTQPQPASLHRSSWKGGADTDPLSGAHRIGLARLDDDEARAPYQDSEERRCHSSKVPGWH